MKKILDFVFSMQFALTLMLVFAISVAIATFIENDFGTPTAKAVVYSATWFEILLAVTAASMLGNILRFKLIQRKKYNVLIFHLGFIIILLGAAITRFIGYEGMMHIREKERTNTIMSDQTYIQVWAKQDQQVWHKANSVLFISNGKNKFSQTLAIVDQKAKVELRQYIANAGETVIEDPNGSPVLSLITINQGDRETRFLRQGECLTSGPVTFCFRKESADTAALRISFLNGELTFMAPMPVYETNMASGESDTLEAFTPHPLRTMKLFTYQAISFVVKSFIEKGSMRLVSAPENSEHKQHNAAIVTLSYKGTEEELVLFGGDGYIGEPATTSIEGVEFTLSYGTRYIEIPFSLELRDFQLERYPGSMSPSSFASEVTLIDERHGIKEHYRIFMNNVLHYGGFRFYQSSYDQDELGTILSVNHDYWGTFVTYLGYLLMAVALVLNFFSKNSRFRFLIRESNRIHLEKKSLMPLIAIMIICSTPAMAQQVSGKQDTYSGIKIIEEDHAKQFGELMVQDNGGRIKPVNTLSSELLRKVYRKDRFMGMNSDQVLLGMIIDPVTWQKVPMIKVSDESLRTILGVEDKYASYEDFIDLERGAYKISRYVDEAYNKKPAERNAFDKDIIKVDERMNICYMIYSGSILRIFPRPDDSTHTWVPPSEDIQQFQDSANIDLVNTMTSMYIRAVSDAAEKGSWTLANESVNLIRIYQEKYGMEVYPSVTKRSIEITYNRLNIFKRLYPFYALLGFFFLILLFAETLSGKQIAKWLKRTVVILIMALFLLHTLGLAARWYISGHAPWSNGYETMIYIAWATVLSGLIFARRSFIALAITTILASLTLMVGNMAWLDPQITNLVPVLKSYWLIIHVAVITASYSFLGIGALIGFLALVLINFRTDKNRTKMSLTLEELTNINEINLTIGLVLVSIGTFLGAVWANESWGRYWGWDPKETWALITMLVYSFIIHMRMIPGLRGNFAFNFAALIGFSSVLMTYFGVNYYLSGLHSYASGDPVPIPRFVYYTLAIIAVVSLFAWLNERKISRS
jgi:cytochrome c-type biogenesis protein CcsB